MPQGWEYKTLTINVLNGHLHDSTVDEQLTEMGLDGWELTHVTPLTLEGKSSCVVHHLRRLADRKRPAGFQP